MKCPEQVKFGKFRAECTKKDGKKIVRALGVDLSSDDAARLAEFLQEALEWLGYNPLECKSYDTSGFIDD